MCVWVCKKYVVHHLVSCAPPSEYRTTLCTIDLRCAAPTCIVHHGAQGNYVCQMWGLPQTFFINFSIFVVDNKRANQGSQCSSVPMFILVVHNVALYQLGAALDDFAC